MAGLWRGAAVETYTLMALVTHADRLVFHHDAATETAAIHGEAVRDTG
jgi:hypothetical protein